jgi:tetratricopeptide (TPR) repeat protein
MSVRFAILAAMLALVPARAAQDDPRLDQLFHALGEAKTAEIAEPIETEIWKVWTESGSATTTLLYERGAAVVEAGNLDLALELMTAVVQTDPHFAEGWNMRATVYVMREDYQSAIEDIEHTLMLEPRHFGALAGLGRIMEQLGNDRLALQAYEAALKINPALEEIQREADSLHLKLDGKRI